MGVEPEDCNVMTFHWLLKKRMIWGVSGGFFVKIIMLRALEGLNGWLCI